MSYDGTYRLYVDDKLVLETRDSQRAYDRYAELGEGKRITFDADVKRKLDIQYV